MMKNSNMTIHKNNNLNTPCKQTKSKSKSKQTIFRKITNKPNRTRNSNF